MKFRWSLFLCAILLGVILSLAFSPISLAAKPTSAATSITAATSKTMVRLPESQIPIHLSNSNPLQTSVDPWGGLLLSFLIIAIVGGGMMVFARWYSGKYRKNGDANKIRVLTQFHLGPKKTLAIVRVAGESILIGITDHNISMLKSLSLLDDEVPNSEEATNFQQTLAHTDERQTPTAHEVVNAPVDDEFQIARIKDRVSNKLKNLRPL